MQNKSKLLLVLYPLFPTPKETESYSERGEENASSGKPRDAGGGEKRGQHVVGPR